MKKVVFLCTVSITLLSFCNVQAQESDTYKLFLSINSQDNKKLLTRDIRQGFGQIKDVELVSMLMADYKVMISYLAGVEGYVDFVASVRILMPVEYEDFLNTLSLEFESEEEFQNHVDSLTQSKIRTAMRYSYDLSHYTLYSNLFRTDSRRKLAELIVASINQDFLDTSRERSNYIKNLLNRTLESDQ